MHNNNNYDFCVRASSHSSDSLYPVEKKELKLPSKNGDKISSVQQNAFSQLKTVNSQCDSAGSGVNFVFVLEDHKGFMPNVENVDAPEYIERSKNLQSLMNAIERQDSEMALNILDHMDAECEMILKRDRNYLETSADYHGLYSVKQVIMKQFKYAPNVISSNRRRGD